MPTAGDLVAAWCSGYTQVRHIQPHPNVVRRVAGVAKNIGKDCTEIDHWRQAWRAAHAAGKQGRWDITCLLIDEQPRSLYPVQQSPGAILRESLARQDRPLPSTAELRQRAIGS